MKKGLVFAIEEFSVFDGPGIRTTVFLKGCPLRCEWCHNPEGQAFQNQVLRAPNGCLSCGACEREAKNENGRLLFTQASIEACPQGLLRYAAVEYTPQALLDKLQKNLPILNASGGGVTFSGGEPTASPDFLLDSLALLEGKTHRAVQTSGYCDSAVFQAVLDNCDYMLFDLKLINEALHQKYTGASVVPILENFKTLAKSERAFVIRVPLIPRVTDTEENLRLLASLLAENGVYYAELLPYNRLAGAKYKLVGREYAPSFDGSAPVESREALFGAYGIQVKIL